MSCVYSGDRRACIFAQEAGWLAQLLRVIDDVSRPKGSISR